MRAKEKNKARNPIFKNTLVNTHSPINKSPLKIIAFSEFLTRLKILA